LISVNCASNNEISFLAPSASVVSTSISLIDVVRALAHTAESPLVMKQTGDTTVCPPETLEDWYLLEGVKQGDEAAMALLYDRHSKSVYWSALRVLRDVPAAEDIVQDIFMMIWRKPDVLCRDSRCFKGWMAVVARNRAYDVLRSHRRCRSGSLENVVLASTCDFELKSEHELMAERASTIIRDLPEKMGVLLEMAFHRGMTHMEIAEETGLPLGTIKTTIRTGLLRVREALSVPCDSIRMARAC